MTDEAPAVLGFAVLVIDCAEPAALARWWSRLVGGVVDVDADGDARLRVPGGPDIDFLRVPDPKTVKNRLHIDLRTSDVAEATEQALRIGATRADDVYTGGSWTVLRDPEGNEFCLLGPSASGPSG
ncbi:MAG TPA: VOC family protein [Acidimicrobiales bacterium]|nr:VOC family protein [Acidimicrobiales bacterium]